MRRGTSGINALIAIDKPCGITSHDVVDRVRRILGERRVGHAGTLDPAASGVLVVGVGQGTRLMGLLTLDRKSYEGRISFGTETATDDAEGEVTRTCAVDPLLADERQARAYLSTLVGDHKQVPPAYSAISVDGRRAYDRARKGEQVQLDARDVTIFSSELLAVSAQGGDVSWDCSFEVSKGCYVRSIARDMGRDLGTAAHLEALRRTSSGPISLDSCLTLDELAELGPDHLDRALLDPARALDLPVRRLGAQEAVDVSCGRRIGLGEGLDLGEGAEVALVSQGRLVGVWSVSGRSLVCKVNFPDGIVGVREDG